MARGVGLRRGSKELADHWRRLVTEWSRSGLTQAEFCRRRRISAPALAWWKRRFRRTDGDEGRGGRPVTTNGRKHARPRTGERVGFAELVVRSGGRDEGLESRSSYTSRAACYEVVLAGGRVIRVGAEFDPGVLGELIAAVEAVPEVASC